MPSGLVVGALTLAATVCVGVLVHEALHVLVLRSGGVRCSLTLLPGDSRRRGLHAVASGSLASVELDAIPPSCSALRLRLAALAPLAMLLPVGCYAWLVTTGAASGSLVESLAAAGWMACALPSPSDFAIVWHPDEARETVAMRSGPAVDD